MNIFKASAVKYIQTKYLIIVAIDELHGQDTPASFIVQCSGIETF
jgi:hypothetical protein